MENSDPVNDSPAAFFALTFLLSVPFYVLAALAYSSVVGEPEVGPLYIALFTVAPITSASILTFRRRGSYGVKELLGRVFDYERIEAVRWYGAILLLPPLIFLISLVGMVWLATPLPPALAPLLALPAVLPFFFLLAAAEEVGWMGYAFEPMQEARGSALRAALELGVIWALWHLPFFVLMMPDLLDLTAQLVSLVGTRVLVVWIFNNAGKSVFAATLFHAVDNTALVTFPEIKTIVPWGSVLWSGLVVVAALAVTFLWGHRSLARYRFSAERDSEDWK